MKHVKLSNAFKVMLASAVLASASAGAAPILSAADAFSPNSVDAVSQSGGAQAPLASHMRLNGGQSHSVAFVGNDNSIVIGYYARGPWSKNEFIRSWQNVGGGKEFVPPVETIAGLPEPSTLALLALGLLGFGVLRSRRIDS